MHHEEVVESTYLYWIAVVLLTGLIEIPVVLCSLPSQPADPLQDICAQQHYDFGPALLSVPDTPSRFPEAGALPQF